MPGNSKTVDQSRFSGLPEVAIQHGYQLLDGLHDAVRQVRPGSIVKLTVRQSQEFAVEDVCDAIECIIERLADPDAGLKFLSRTTPSGGVIFMHFEVLP